VKNTDRNRARTAWAGLVAATVALLLLHGCEKPEIKTITIVAVGGIACAADDPGNGTSQACRDKDTGALAYALKPEAFIGLGDYQYETPTDEDYNSIYDTSWGKLKTITYPAIGNQEYKVHEANTFHNYFGERSGPDQGYWSVNLAQWHVVFLNSNCTVVTGGCGTDSPQNKWLRENLDANNSRCTMAVWHHPRWSNGIAGADARTSALYKTLVEHNVDILLSAHEADYERFTKLDENGKPDSNATRQLVVGTGGQATYNPQEGNAAWRDRTSTAGSQKLITDSHGILKMRLDSGSYTWEFHTTENTIEDSGEQTCNR